MIETTTVEAAMGSIGSTVSKPKSSMDTTPTPKQQSHNKNKSRRSMSFGFLLAHGACLMISTVIVKSFWEFENASRALAFYGVYHRYGWNQVIHFFGVPGIIWSLLVFFAHVPLPVTVMGIVGEDRSLNYAGFISICYNLFYLFIDPFGAVMYAPILYVMYASALSVLKKDQAEAEEATAAVAKATTTTTTTTNTTSGSTGTGTPTNATPWYGTGKALKFALVVHVLCWYVQIHLGHTLIEGAQPAVLQSLGGALSVAPLFAFYEGLWFLGINKGLQESTRLLVEEYTQELCARKGIEAMKACSSLMLQD